MIRQVDDLGVQDIAILTALHNIFPNARKETINKTYIRELNLARGLFGEEYYD